MAGQSVDGKETLWGREGRREGGDGGWAREGRTCLPSARPLLPTGLTLGTHWVPTGHFACRLLTVKERKEGGQT